MVSDIRMCCEMDVHGCAIYVCLLKQRCPLRVVASMSDLAFHCHLLLPEYKSCKTPEPTAAMAKPTTATSIQSYNLPYIVGVTSRQTVLQRRLKYTKTHYNEKPGAPNPR